MDAEGKFVDDLTPAASKAVDDIKELANLTADKLAKTRPKVEGEIVAVGLEAIERTRRKLSARIGSARDATDRAAAVEVKKGFDAWFQSAVDNALFEGSDEALQALREARATHTLYRRMFPAGAKDDAGELIEKVVTRAEGTDGSVVASELANAMYGATQVGNKGLSLRLARRLDRIFGRQSAEFRTIKQGLWDRLTSGKVPGQELGNEALANRVLTFLDPKGPSRQLATYMFTVDERNTMRRFAESVKALVPMPRATNPPRSGFTALRELRAHFGNLLGFGGIAGAAAGEPISLIATGASILGKLKPIVQAARAVKPITRRQALTGTSLPVIAGGQRGVE